MTSTVFPMFLKIEHQPNRAAETSFLAAIDSISSNGRRRFTAGFGDAGSALAQSVAAATPAIEKQFDALGKEAGQMLRRVMDASLTDTGSLNLGVPELQRKAAALQQEAVAARELAQATEIAAREAGDFTQAARLQVAAMQAAAKEAESAAAEARSYAAAQAQVQEALNRSASAVDFAGTSLAGHRKATAAGAAANDNLRQGLGQLSYQLNDISTMFALGAKGSQIFASQAGQVIQAVQLMSGGTSRLAGFLGGPWGIALTTATIALTPFIGQLLDTGDAVESLADRAESAMQRVRQSLAQASEFTDAASLNVEARVTAMGDAARARRDIQRLQGAAAAGSRFVTTAGSSVGALDTTALAEARDRLRDAEKRQRDAEANLDALRNAADVRAIQARNQERLSGPSRSGTGAGSTDRGGPRVTTLSAEAQALQRATAEADAYVTSLEQQIATMTLSAGQLRQLEVARAKEAAGTDEQRQRIEQLNAAREEAISTQERQAAIAREAAALAEFQSSTIIPLQQELQLIGLVGPARERAALALEETAFKADAASRGIADVNAAWEQYRNLQIEIMDRGTVLDREREAAELFAQDLAQLAGAVSNLGGAGSALGGLINLASGNLSGITGPIGALLNIRTGTSTDEEGRVIARRIGDELTDVFKINGVFGETLTTALEGAGTGSIAAGAVFGQQGTLGQFTSAAGGALGQAAGASLTEGLTGFLGNAGGPIGSLVGGLLGGVVGGLFGGGAKSGAAVITGTNSLSLSGSNSDYRGAAGTLGGSVTGGLQSIADQLGADLGAFRVSIGMYRDNYRVSTSGSTKLGGYKGSAAENERKFGLYDFETEEAAIAFALRDAISDGAIKGLSAAEQRLIQQQGDIERALQDVLDFRSVFDRLAEAKDPVGFALDGLDDEFEGLKELFERAGASTQEYADLEELYWLERGQLIEDATSAELGTLKSFLNELTAGNDALSLRDRRAMALTEYMPLANRVRAGDATAYDDFADAARQLLEIERQASGSQASYFALLDQVTALTQQAVDGGAGINFADRDSPFGPGGDNGRLISSVDTVNDTLERQFDALNRNIGALRSDVQASGRQSIRFSGVDGGW